MHGNTIRLSTMLHQCRQPSLQTLPFRALLKADSESLLLGGEGREASIPQASVYTPIVCKSVGTCSMSLSFF